MHTNINTFSNIYSSSDFQNIFTSFSQTQDLASVLNLYHLRDYMFSLYIDYLVSDLSSYESCFYKQANNYMANKEQLNKKCKSYKVLENVYALWYEIKNSKLDTNTLTFKSNQKYNNLEIETLKSWNTKLSHLNFNNDLFSRVNTYNISKPIDVQCELVTNDENHIYIDNMLYNYLMYNDIYKDDDLKSNSLLKALNSLNEKSKSDMQIYGDFVSINSKKAMYPMMRIPDIKKYAYYLPLIGMKVDKSLYRQGRFTKTAYTYTISSYNWERFKYYMNNQMHFTNSVQGLMNNLKVSNNKVLNDTNANDNKFLNIAKYIGSEDENERDDVNPKININESDDDMSDNSKSNTPQSSPKDLSHQGCYFIQCAADRNLNKYKIGRGEDVLRRITTERSYQNCKIISINIVSDHIACEKMIIDTFDKLFTKVEKDNQGHYGKETYYITDEQLHYAKHVFDAICDEFF